MAREVHAATGAPLAEDPTDRDAEPAEGATPAAEQMTVEIADPDICLRFTARVFEDVKIGPSPEWLKQRLSAAGQRPISNVVDITNYVMLCTGQPLHAFDMDEVRGGRIVVRRAEPGERMTTLDDVEREFDPDMALVCDAEGPSGIAGVMGGQISEVSDRHHARADGGGHLGGAEHPPDLQEARAAQRGLHAVREAAASRAGDRRPAARRPADGRAVRRADGARHDRRLPRAAAAPAP